MARSPITDAALAAQLDALANGQTLDAATAAQLDELDRARRAAAARQWMDQQNAKLAREGFDALNPVQKFVAGYGKPGLQLYEGVKHLVSAPTEQERLDALYMQQMHGPAATTGEIAGNVAQLAVPAGGAANVAGRVGAVLPRALARYAPAAVDMATNAGMEALKDPGPGGSRGGNAALGAAGSAVGSALAPVVRGVVQGLRPGYEAAKEFVTQGIPLTPGQLRGGIVRAVEDKLSAVPLLGSAIRARKQEAFEAWNRHVLNELVPEGEVTAAGHEGIKQARALFNDAYGRLWANDIPADTAALSGAWSRIGAGAPAEVGQRLAQLQAEHLAAGGAVPGSSISYVDDTLRSLASKSAKRGEQATADAYASARSALRSTLPQEVNAELSRIDGLYRQFATARRAAGYVAAGQTGVFTPQQLLGAAKAGDKSAGKGAFATGTATLQPQANAAAAVLGRNVGTPSTAAQLLTAGALGGAGYVEPTTLAATAAARAAYSKPGVAWMNAQTDWQRTLNDLFNNPRAQMTIDALRRRVRPSTLGAAGASALPEDE